MVCHAVTKAQIGNVAVSILGVKTQLYDIPIHIFASPISYIHQIMRNLSFGFLLA